MTDYMTVIKRTKTFRPSSRLYTQPKLIDGISSIFNIAGNNVKFNYSKSAYKADCKSIRRDWELVGDDLRAAIATHIDF